MELLRHAVLRRLRDAFAAGDVRIETFEHRVAAALRARSELDLDETTWDLPGADSAPCARIVLDGASIAFGDEPRTWVIGRSRSCDVRLHDILVSRRHAVLSSRGGTCTIRDLDSTNGLLVNGVPVSIAALHPGDEISFGGAIVAEVR